MKQKVELQSGYVLHYRAYRETSLLIDCFTKDYGRIAMVARGVKRPRSPQRGLLQPFTGLYFSWSGMRELMNLRHVEANGQFYTLSGNILLCGFYLNELLLRLLQGGVSFPHVYQQYEKTLLALAAGHDPEPLLRYFERDLLHALGYGLQLSAEARTGIPLLPDAYYRYEREEGPIRHEAGHENGMVYPGRSLIALQKSELNDKTTKRDAKHLLRQVLYALLGAKPLKTRELFRQLGRGENDKKTDFIGSQC